MVGESDRKILFLETGGNKDAEHRSLGRWGSIPAVLDRIRDTPPGTLRRSPSDVGGVHVLSLQPRIVRLFS